MSKVKRMLRPGNFWMIGEHESWFTDMAQEGLYLKSVGSQFAKFTKGKPKQMRYRIDVSQGKKITSETKEMYLESGWDYVTSYDEFNVFSSPIAANAPELHTDPAEQGYTLDYLSKKITKSATGFVISVALIIGLLLTAWFINSAPYLDLVNGQIIEQATLIIIYSYMVYESLRGAISIHTLRKTLLEGKSINHSAPWKKQHGVKLMISGIYIALAILVAIFPFIQISMSESNTLPIGNIDLPIVRLIDVEKNPDLVRKPSYIHDNVDWGNRYSYDWSPLAPVQYKTNEIGIVPNKMWEDGSGEYSPSIRTEVYQLRLLSITEGFISDLIKKEDLEYRDREFIKIVHPDFDNLIVHEADEFKEIFVSKGKAVMHVRYHGYADIDSVIGATVPKISLIAE